MKFREILNVAHVMQEGEERTSDVHASEDVDFVSLMLTQPVLEGLKRSGFKKPSPVQLSAIPVGKLGVDLIVQAKSGTGKTCVFAVMALESVLFNNKEPQALVLAPTREIAQQIFESTRSIGSLLIQKSQLSIGLFIGGTNLRTDFKALDKGCQIIIGTPGRVCQLVQRGKMDLAGVKLFVLDEADKLMEDSYQESVNWLFSQLPSSKQVGVFSATYPEELDQFLSKYMETPTMVRLDAADVQLLGIKQFLSLIDDKKAGSSMDFLLESDEERWTRMWDLKLDRLHILLRTVKFTQCLAFCNYQDKAEQICDKLVKLGISADYISSQLEQEQRSSVIKRLKQFKCRLLISTDLTARGIDAQNVDFVVNLETPSDPETYFHRIGRAGRFGGYGAAITLAVNGIDDRRFFAIGSNGEFNTKLLPPIESGRIPSDLCSNREFWESCSPVPFPLKKAKTEATDGHLPGSTRSGAASQSWRSTIRDELSSQNQSNSQSVSRGFGKKGKPMIVKDPNRLDPLEFMQRFGENIEFDDDELDKNSSSTHSYDRDVLLDFNNPTLGIVLKKRTQEDILRSKDRMSPSLDMIATAVAEATETYCRANSPIIPEFRPIESIDDPVPPDRKQTNQIEGESKKHNSTREAQHSTHQTQPQNDLLTRLIISKRAEGQNPPRDSQAQAHCGRKSMNPLDPEELNSGKKTASAAPSNTQLMKEEELCNNESDVVEPDMVSRASCYANAASSVDSLSDEEDGKVLFGIKSPEEILNQWEDDRFRMKDNSRHKNAPRTILKELQFPWEAEKSPNMTKDATHPPKNVLDRYLGVSASGSGLFTGFKSAESLNSKKTKKGKGRIAKEAPSKNDDGDGDSLRSWDDGELLDEYCDMGPSKPVVEGVINGSEITRASATVPNTYSDVSKAYADLCAPESLERKTITLSEKRTEDRTNQPSHEKNQRTPKMDAKTSEEGNIKEVSMESNAAAAYALLRKEKPIDDAQTAYAKLLGSEPPLRADSPALSSASSTRRKRQTVSDRFRTPQSQLPQPTLGSSNGFENADASSTMENPPRRITLASVIASSPPVRVPDSEELDAASRRKTKQLEAKLLGIEYVEDEIMNQENTLGPGTINQQISTGTAQNLPEFNFDKFLEKYKLKSVAPCAQPQSEDREGTNALPPAVQSLFQTADANQMVPQKAVTSTGPIDSGATEAGGQLPSLSDWNITEFSTSTASADMIKATFDRVEGKNRFIQPSVTYRNSAPLKSAELARKPIEERAVQKWDDGKARYSRKEILDINQKVLGSPKYSRDQMMEVYDSKTDQHWKKIAIAAHGFHRELNDTQFKDVFRFDSRRRGPLNRRPNISSISSFASSILGEHADKQEEVNASGSHEPEEKPSSSVFKKPVVSSDVLSVEGSPSARTKFYEYLNQSSNDEIMNAVSGRKSEFPLHFDDPVPPASNERPIAKAKTTKGSASSDKLFFQKKIVKKPKTKQQTKKIIDLPIIDPMPKERFHSEANRKLPCYDELCDEYRMFMARREEEKLSDSKKTNGSPCVRRAGYIGTRLTTREWEVKQAEIDFILDSISSEILEVLIADDDADFEEEYELEYPSAIDHTFEDTFPQNEQVDNPEIYDCAQSRNIETPEGPMDDLDTTLTFEKVEMDSGTAMGDGAEMRKSRQGVRHKAGIEKGSGDEEYWERRKSEKENEEEKYGERSACEAAYLESLKEYNRACQRWEEAFSLANQQRGWDYQNEYLHSMINEATTSSNLDD